MKVRVFRLRRALLPCLLAAVFFALALALHFTGAYAVYTGGTVRKLPIYSVEREDKKIAISFDCAWGVDYTQEILDVLAREKVRATFFMVEFWAEKYPEYVRKIALGGNEIGTHSSTHSYMSKQSEEEIRAELASSSAAIEKVTGKKVELFRAPYGDYDDLLIQTAQDMGLYTIQWDVDSLDWKDLSAAEISMRIVNSVKSGSIILCHNNGLHTAEALPIVLDTLKNSGYEFVPIGELIYRENYTIDASGRQCPAES
ncbi:MAG TPA: polysaccharide deacetylase family protein [Candidatus Borkfalkia excrementipullorum]|nr:polysaccharide deacetylase family protein [Candidatus Borkfalkia excrementipullorum]